ncbi:MAG TPA: PaaI family thioesterase [Candidatus Baltobacteraceae bacterium]|jgi:uncharacterized protein (TIGR00369 family)
MRERTFGWTDPRELAQSALGEEGLHWLRRMKDGDIPPPPAAQLLGMEIEEIDRGRVAFSMRAEEWMCTPQAVVHGGMAATLLDTVLALAVASKLPKGKTCQTVQLNVNFLRPLLPTGEKVVAEATAIHVGTTIGTSEGRIVDARGKTIAHATATLAILGTEKLDRAALPDA